MGHMTVTEVIAAVEQALPQPINYNDRATITLHNGALNVELKPSPVDGLPSVKLTDRLAEILGLSVQPNYQPFSLNYSYHAGSEDARYGRHQNACFSGSYHPNVVCEGQWVCTWCGCLL